MDTSQEMIQLLWPTLLLLCHLCFVKGEVRCYCNDASCARTGYMCKSAIGRCFSQLTYERDSTRSLHGCADTLPAQDRKLCGGSGSVAEADRGEAGRGEWPVLLCCKDEMCNYVDSLDINIYVTKSNSSRDAVSWSGADDHLGSARADSGRAGDQADLWFKAAVIAVPIAGGFILVLLVLLAVRVLRNDSRRHRQLVQLRQHRSLTKAQLYVADHFYQNQLLEAEQCPGHCSNPACYDSDSSHSLNQSKCPQNYHVTSITNSHAAAPPVGVHGRTNHVYRDVHIKVDHTKHGYEKIRPVSEGSNLEESCDSVLLWGNPRKPHNAASV